jgi:hypothetical protein
MKSSVLVLLSIFASVYSQKIIYLSGYAENDKCPYGDNPRILGVCRKISDCPEEFELYKANKRKMRVCSYNAIASNTAVCCQSAAPAGKAPTAVLTEQRDTQYSLDYANCLEQFRTHRRSKVDVNDLVTAIETGKREITDEDCAIIALHGKPTGCTNRTITHLSFIAFGSLVEEGDWQNMAAIGWSSINGRGPVEYNCGGVIVNDRFVVTAAHCGRKNGRAPDTIRVGDRFLATAEDDNHAQQVGIESLLIHPSYKSSEVYNDIALIKTSAKIKFNKFVAPSCILIDDSNELYPYVAGYGQVSEIQISNDRYFQIFIFRQTDFASEFSNILQEIRVDNVKNEKCNETFGGQTRIPNGILPSQICVQGIPTNDDEVPDSW